MKVKLLAFTLVLGVVGLGGYFAGRLSVTSVTAHLFWIVVSSAIALVFVIAVGLALIYPQRSMRKRRSQADFKDLEPDVALEAENNMRVSFLQAITAAILICGAGITLYQVIGTAKTTEKQLQLTQESQEGQEFTQALDQLVSSDKSSQVVAVSALVGLAERDPKPYAREVINVLAQYVRTAAGPSRGNETVPLSIRKPGVQAALTALLQLPLSRVRVRAKQPLNLTTGDTSRLNLKLADFQGANLTGVDLESDDLDGVNFDGARLVYACLKDVSVNGATFYGAHLEGATLKEITNLPKRKKRKPGEPAEPEAFYDRHTQWPQKKNTNLIPPGFAKPARGAELKTMQAAEHRDQPKKPVCLSRQGP